MPDVVYLSDRIKELTYVIGTSNFPLAGPVQGFSSFSSFYSDGDVLFYAATNGSAYEVGSGVFNSGISGFSITRFPFKSTNNNQKVSFPEGVKEIYATYPATHAVYTGSGLADFNIPQNSGLAYWKSSNMLQYDTQLVWNDQDGYLGVNTSDPQYGIDLQGSADQSIIRSSGIILGSSGIYFPPGNNYLGGRQTAHYERNQLDQYAFDNSLLGELTGSNAVLQLSGVANQFVLFRKQNAGFVFAGPPSGCTPPCSPGYPSFRQLTLQDVPELLNVSGILNDKIFTVLSNIDTVSGALNTKINNVSGVLRSDLTTVSGIVNSITTSTTVDICQGRLTLEDGIAISYTDQLNKSIVYYAPLSSTTNKVSLYNGTTWQVINFTQKSLTLFALSNNTNYDVFGYLNGGDLVLELGQAWTNGNTRSQALTLKDDVLCKSNDLTRRYLGTIRTTSSSTTEDSTVKRFVWNANNRVEKSLQSNLGSYTWTYSTNQWRPTRNIKSSISLINGFIEDSIDVKAGIVYASDGSVVVTTTTTTTTTTSGPGTTTTTTAIPLNWTQRGMDIDGETAGDYSGHSVRLNSTGDVVAIGAIFNDGNGAESGHVRVYSWNGSSWVQRGVDINGEAAGDYSGHSVSLNSTGDVVAIGAILNDGNGIDSGHVRVYSWNGSSWVQRGVDINGEAAVDNSGYSVSLNSTGDVVAIGAILNDGNGAESGHVRVYSWNGSSWVQRGVDINGEAAGDWSGSSVSLNSAGDVVAIGAIQNDGNGAESGHVRVYSWNGSSWVQRGVDINGEVANDYSGHSVSLNSAGDVVAIGAYLNDGNGTDSGHVRVYSWNGSSWIQRGVDINGEAAGDYSGFSVSLNSAGDVVAIGATLNDGNGAESGHVRVYSWNGSSWIQRGVDINGEAAGDYSGRSVSLNSTGDVVAIGAILNDGNGVQSGHVRVYTAPITTTTTTTTTTTASPSSQNLWAFGLNTDYQLGDNTTTQRNAPTLISASSWIDISCGTYHSAAIRSDNKLFLWGDNSFYQSGSSALTDIQAPTLQGYLSSQNFTKVVCGSYQTFALDQFNRLWACGRNGDYQIGNGSSYSVTQMYNVDAFETWLDIAAGDNHTIGIKTDGTLWGWGTPSTNRCLDPSFNTTRTIPSQISLVGINGTPVKVVSNLHHNLMLTSTGYVYSWGNNLYGQIGNNTTTVPTSFFNLWNPSTNGGLPAYDIACGLYHSLVLLNYGNNTEIRACGRNQFGQLGDGTFQQKNTTVAVDQSNFIGVITKIYAGAYHSLAIDTAGRAYSWGNNVNGQLGYTGPSQAVPAPIPSFSNVTELSAGFYHTLAIK